MSKDRFNPQDPDSDGQDPHLMQGQNYKDPRTTRRGLLSRVGSVVVGGTIGGLLHLQALRELLY